MKPFILISLFQISFFITIFPPGSSSAQIRMDKITSYIYPEVNEVKPNLPSPFVSTEGDEYVLAVTKDSAFAIIPVTLSNDRGICKQLIVDTLDFPTLAKTGLHSLKELKQTVSITGRSIDEITRLARPGALSQAGFLGVDEDIISVIEADNAIVNQMGFTHPQLAKPLFHILNMMETDLNLERWNLSRHRWENIQYFYYNDEKVYLDVEDTKGGQKSIFDDGIEGGFYIQIWGELNDVEKKLLKERFPTLNTEELNTLQTQLSSMDIGEIQPQYIMRYGFYEGHTFWRADPIAISYIFGFKTLPELLDLFGDRLYDLLFKEFIEQ